MKKLVYFFFVFLLLPVTSCATSRSSRAMRKAERMMERQAAEAKKEYKQAKTVHYKHQAPKTKKMIREDRRRARQLNRHFRH